MSVNFNNSVDGGIARFRGTAGGAVSGAPANDTRCNIDESSISDTQQIFLGWVWEGGNERSLYKTSPLGVINGSTSGDRRQGFFYSSNSLINRCDFQAAI